MTFLQNTAGALTSGRQTAIARPSTTFKEMDQ